MTGNVDERYLPGKPFGAPEGPKDGNGGVVESAGELSGVGDAHEHGEGEVKEAIDDFFVDVFGFGLEVDEVEVGVGEEGGSEELEEDDDEDVEVFVEDEVLSPFNIIINHYG